MKQTQTGRPRLPLTSWGHAAATVTAALVAFGMTNGLPASASTSKALSSNDILTIAGDDGGPFPAVRTPTAQSTAWDS